MVELLLLWMTRGWSHGCWFGLCSPAIVCCMLLMAYSPNTLTVVTEYDIKQQVLNGPHSLMFCSSVEA